MTLLRRRRTVTDQDFVLARTPERIHPMTASPTGGTYVPPGHSAEDSVLRTVDETLETLEDWVVVGPEGPPLELNLDGRIARAEAVYRDLDDRVRLADLDDRPALIIARSEALWTLQTLRDRREATPAPGQIDVIAAQEPEEVPPMTPVPHYTLHGAADSILSVPTDDPGKATHARALVTIGLPDGLTYVTARAALRMGQTSFVMDLYPDTPGGIIPTPEDLEDRAQAYEAAWKDGHAAGIQAVADLDAEPPVSAGLPILRNLTRTGRAALLEAIALTLDDVPTPMVHETATAWIRTLAAADRRD